MTTAPALGRELYAPPSDDQATRLRALVADGAPQSPNATPSVKRPEAPPTPRGRRPVMIAVASGKGGVGKTNVAVNLAYALAAIGKRTTIIDGDLSLGNADLICGVSPRANFGHVVEGRRSLQEVMIDLRPNLRLLPGTSGAARLADLGENERRRFVGALRLIEGGNDVLVVDCGAGIGPWVLSLVGAADRTLLVTTPEPTAIADAYALIKCAVKRSARCGDRRPDIELVTNQVSGFKQAQHVHGRMAAVCDRFLRVPLPLGGWIRLDPKVPLAVRNRVAFIQHCPRCDAARDIHRLAASLHRNLVSQEPEETQRGGPLMRAMRFLRVGQ